MMVAVSNYTPAVRLAIDRVALMVGYGTNSAGMFPSRLQPPDSDASLAGAFC